MKEKIFELENHFKKGLEMIQELKKENFKKLAFEVIYDEKGEKILDFMAIDPNSITKGFYSSENRNVWIQYPDDEKRKRILYDTQIVTNF
jgi:hypothetical protein